MTLYRVALFIILVLGLGGTAYGDEAGMTHQTYGGRDMLIYMPGHLPQTGSRALVVVLHGGLGNAERIAGLQSESALNMNAVATKYGFIVAYLNGTAATRLFGPDKEAWNAGDCCGQPAANNVDDTGYIAGAVASLARQYGIDGNRIYGIGHSNGAMMTQRLMCQTNLYTAGIAISGPLGVAGSCVAARGRAILAIHGADDANVPVAGGRGTKGLSHTDFKSEAQSKQVYDAAGANYTVQIVKGADHDLDNIEAVIERTEGQTIAEKAAHFFGLAP